MGLVDNQTNQLGSFKFFGLNQRPRTLVRGFSRETLRVGGGVSKIVVVLVEAQINISSRMRIWMASGQFRS